MAVIEQEFLIEEKGKIETFNLLLGLNKQLHYLLDANLNLLERIERNTAIGASNAAYKSPPPPVKQRARIIRMVQGLPPDNLGKVPSKSTQMRKVLANM